LVEILKSDEEYDKSNRESGEEDGNLASGEASMNDSNKEIEPTRESSENRASGEEGCGNLASAEDSMDDSNKEIENTRESSKNRAWGKEDGNLAS
jgi:hypothetical protein